MDPTPTQDRPETATGGRTRRKLRWTLMLRATFRGDCPNCVFGHLFDGPFRARRHCEVCAMGFEPNDDGSNWLGAAFLVLSLASVVLIGEGVALALAFGLFEGYGVVMALSAVLLVALTYRPARGWWVWCQWTFGFLGE